MEQSNDPPLPDSNEKRNSIHNPPQSPIREMTIRTPDKKETDIHV
jgi:hypothetical protein